MPTTAVIHSEDTLNLVGNLSIITDQFTHSSPESSIILQSVDKLLGRVHGIHIRDQRVFTNKIWAMATPESMAGVSEKMESVATASFLHGMWKAGNLDLKCFLLGNLVDVTVHSVEFSKVIILRVSALTQPK